jgi:predicted dehydrogenase
MAKRAKKSGTYGKGVEVAARRIAAPELAYQPRDPAKYHPPIGLIGCGGITQSHLRAYRKAGYNVVALCDVDIERAKARQRELYPRAQVYSDYRELLRRDDIEVVDIATHPQVRRTQIRDSLLAGKHVLSQKPFVLDLAHGRQLADLADKRGLKLAVNQNGRWAPHFSYIRAAIAEGLIGKVLGAHLSVHWNHDWIAETAFNSIEHVILYDFAIHWFDIVTCFMGGKRARRVYASNAPATGQRATPPLLAQVLIEYEDSQASLVFDGFTQYGPRDSTFVTGTQGVIQSAGPNLDKQSVTLITRDGYSRPKLAGKWFDDGFHGTMAELLCAIEEHRQPANNARDNLESLALCFAAVRSADVCRPQVPGSVTRLSGTRPKLVLRRS